MKKKLKKQISKYLKNLNKFAIEEKCEEFLPKKFGEQRGVSFEMKGLADTFCSVNNWANGEGFDISWETRQNKNSWESKHISIHRDELDVLLAALEDLGEFNDE